MHFKKQRALKHYYATFQKKLNEKKILSFNILHKSGTLKIVFRNTIINKI